MRRVPKDMLWIIITLLVLWLVLTNLTDPPASTPLSNVVLASTLVPIGILVWARRALTRAQLAQYPGWTAVVARTTSTQEGLVVAAGYRKMPRATLLYGPSGVQMWGGPEYTVPLFDHPWSAVTAITEATGVGTGFKGPVVRIALADGTVQDVGVQVPKEIQARYPGTSRRGALVADMLAVRAAA